MFTVSKTTRRALVIAAAVGFLPAAGMAQAAKAELTGNDMATANGSQAATPTNAPVKVYCAGRTTSGANEVTGSLLKRKVCKTREQWLADGVKIDEGK